MRPLVEVDFISAPHELQPPLLHSTEAGIAPEVPGVTVQYQTDSSCLAPSAIQLQLANVEDGKASPKYGWFVNRGARDEREGLSTIQCNDMH